MKDERVYFNPSEDEAVAAFEVQVENVMKSIAALRDAGHAASMEHGFIFAARVGNNGESYDLSVFGTAETAITLAAIVAQETANTVSRHETATAELG